MPKVVLSVSVLCFSSYFYLGGAMACRLVPLALALALESMAAI